MNIKWDMLVEYMNDSCYRNGVGIEKHKTSVIKNQRSGHHSGIYALVTIIDGINIESINIYYQKSAVIGTLVKYINRSL